MRTGLSFRLVSVSLILFLQLGCGGSNGGLDYAGNAGPAVQPPFGSLGLPAISELRESAWLPGEDLEYGADYLFASGDVTVDGTSAVLSPAAGSWSWLCFGFTYEEEPESILLSINWDEIPDRGPWVLTPEFGDECWEPTQLKTPAINVTKRFSGVDCELLRENLGDGTFDFACCVVVDDECTLGSIEADDELDCVCTCDEWSTEDGDDVFYCCDVDDQGNSYACGAIQEWGDISLEASDLLVIKLNSMGAFCWGARYPTSTIDIPADIVCDGGKAYIVGTTCEAEEDTDLLIACIDGETGGCDAAIGWDSG